MTVTFCYVSLEDTTWNSGLIFKRRDFIVILWLVTHSISRAWPYFVHGYLRPHSGLKPSQPSITGFKTSLYRVKQTLRESDKIFLLSPWCLTSEASSICLYVPTRHPHCFRKRCVLWFSLNGNVCFSIHIVWLINVLWTQLMPLVYTVVIYSTSNS